MDETVMRDIGLQGMSCMAKCEQQRWQREDHHLDREMKRKTCERSTKEETVDGLDHVGETEMALLVMGGVSFDRSTEGGTKGVEDVSIIETGRTPI
uniref:Uncharacterized protein n=1 Tax=Pristionchus pacificus TaxID=54126 RepID=A0A2A6BCI8_PRIPA|eukprot:PDM63585.1 hypothetical protein PRIPAC_49558 [Pristionchus pacificus]